MSISAFSGGATGADTYWDQEAKRRKLPLVFTHFGPRDVQHLKPEHLREVDNAVSLAAFALHKSFPKQLESLNLLRRNYLIAKGCDELFAVGTMQQISRLPYIRGGTGWTVAMCQRLRKRVVFFNQLLSQWWVWEPTSLQWRQLAAAQQEFKLSQRPGLVGSRNLSLDGQVAIQHLYTLSFLNNKR